MHLRKHVPYILADNSVDWLNSALDQFWLIYGRWASAYVTSLIEYYVEAFGLEVDEVTLGPNPLRATDAIGMHVCGCVCIYVCMYAWRLWGLIRYVQRMP